MTSDIQKEMDISMDSIFQIGTFCFRLISPDEVTPPENFMLFEQPDAEPTYTYEIALCTGFPQPQGMPVTRREDLLVFDENGLERRYIGMKGQPGFYACYWEEDESRARIHLAPGILPLLRVDPVYLALFAMERHMLQRDHLVLHCAYMAYKDTAVLFSAPSETGKTTQATLWQRYRGTRVVNGDKSLLICDGEKWTANGWPVCGSSQVCHNEGMPIRAIVMLSQGKENTIVRLSPFQAFSQIYSQITINFWNKDAQKRAMDLIENLVTCVPVYHLSCTISEEAVETLERMIREDD